ncbi:GNAT family N-acetyltransferase [Chryseobacterium sp.]|uniref:GNAT family N-acetyltransferase n=1 Tax=Chryseobacterium sp. TaxID=1871047 RepID=UPI002896DE21|nr:GNAT family N-acetyltransferase [Chryseobacterium sp.]
MKYLLTHQETERLLFRKLENSDFDHWLELFKDEHTTKMLGMESFKTPKERCEKWFEWTFHRYENNLGGQNVLISKETQQLIGQCGLLVREVENKFELEIAYSILPEFRGQGFAI